MKANHTTNQTQTLTAVDLQSTYNCSFDNNTASISENPTVFGESDQQNPFKSASQIPQSSFSRVEQWISEWKQGIMRIEAGLY